MTQIRRDAGILLVTALVTMAVMQVILSGGSILPEDTTVWDCRNDSRDCTRTEMANRSGLLVPDNTLVEGTFAPRTYTETVRTPGLEDSFDLEFLPDGTPIISSKDGTVRTVRHGQAVRVARPDDLGDRVMGARGIAVDPEFADTRYVYLYTVHETRDDSSTETASIARFTLQDGALQDRKTLLDGIPVTGTTDHDGGGLSIGPDGMLYATTGGTEFTRQAPDPDSLAGKTLRIAPDGSIPGDNPSDSPVYTTGHGSPRDIAWDPEERPFVVEAHYRTVAEINRLEPGGSYGSAASSCGEPGEGWRDAAARDPVRCISRSLVDPYGIAIPDDPGHPWHGDLFVAERNAQHVHRYGMDGTDITASTIFFFRREAPLVAGNTWMDRALVDVEFHDGALWVLGEWSGMTVLEPA